MKHDVKLCTRKEAAYLLGLKPQTLAKWAMTGKNLSVIRIGSRSARYSLTEIEDFIARCTTHHGSINGDTNNTEVDDE
jgi:predicted DNA-binding transcriptional regulator AlpA